MSEPVSASRGYAGHFQVDTALPVESPAPLNPVHDDRTGEKAETAPPILFSMMDSITSLVAARSQREREKTMITGINRKATALQRPSYVHLRVDGGRDLHHHVGAS